MKKLILLIVVCMGMFTYNYTTNANVVLADQNNHSSKIEKKNVKTTNKGKSNNWKHLANYVPIAITFGSVILSLLYYGYIIRHLNYLEKRLLNIKMRFYIMVSTVAITILTYTLIVSAIIFESETRVLILLLAFYSLSLIIIAIIACKQAKNIIIVFEYNNKEYQFLHRIDDSTISALPLGLSPIKDNDIICLFTINDLSSHRIYTKRIRKDK